MQTLQSIIARIKNRLSNLDVEPIGKFRGFGPLATAKSCPHIDAVTCPLYSYIKLPPQIE